MAKQPAEIRRYLKQVDKLLIGNVMQGAWAVADVETRNSTITVRMPENVPLFDEIWDLIKEIKVKGHKIQRRGKWPSVIELDDIMGNIHWLWPRWIPKGFLTLLVGEPGTGKSLIALDWVRRVTSGVQWPLEEIKSSPGIVGWVETESSQQLLSVRSISMKVSRERIILPGFGGDLLGQPDLMNEDDKKRLVAMIEYNGPELVIIDSLGGAHTKGENRIEEVRPMLDFLAKLSRDKDIAIVAVHHLRKRSKGEDLEFTLDRIRGSSAISAFARSVIGIEEMVSGSLKMRVVKANLCRKPHLLQATIVEDESNNPRSVDYQAFVAPVEEKTKKEKCADWLYEYLNGHGEVRVNELIELAGEEGFSRQTFYDCRDIIGNALWSNGTGKEKRWSLVKNPVQ